MGDVRQPRYHTAPSWNNTGPERKQANIAGRLGENKCEQFCSVHFLWPFYGSCEFYGTEFYEHEIAIFLDRNENHFLGLEIRYFPMYNILYDKSSVLHISRVYWIDTLWVTSGNMTQTKAFKGWFKMRGRKSRIFSAFGDTQFDLSAASLQDPFSSGSIRLLQCKHHSFA